MAVPRMIIGALGWDHDHWSGAFYPDDLPQEWRLSYYANEFSGVLIPAAVWGSGDEVLWESWLDDVPEDFLFFLEQPSVSAGLEMMERCGRVLGRQYAGSPATGESILTPDDEFDLRRLRQRLQSLAADAQPGRVPALFLAGRPPDIGRLREVRLLMELAGLA